MKAFAIILIAAVAPIAAALAEIPFEAPPTVRAADLIPADILSGPRYSIDVTVPTDGFMGDFRIHSDFGDFECLGREMLYTRISELRALEKVEKVSKAKAFVDAVKGAAEEPVKAAAKIVENPVGAVVETPIGVGRLFGKVVDGAGDAGKDLGKLVKHDDAKAGRPKPPPSRDDPIGYNEARNKWAKKLGVDPYTTNRELALKLNHLGMISFATDKVAGFGLDVGTSGLGAIAGWLSWLPDLDEHVLTAPPPDVTKMNARKLASLAVSKPAMKPLLENAWFSPTLQSRFVKALAVLKGSSNPASIVELAGAVESEEQARFLCRSLEVLDRYHESVAPLRELRAFAGVPAGVTAEGTLVVAAAVDLLSWTQVAGEFAADPHPGAGRSLLVVTGPLTPRARAGFAAQGWKVAESTLPSSVAAR